MGYMIYTVINIIYLNIIRYLIFCDFFGTHIMCRDDDFVRKIRLPQRKKTP